MIERRVMVLQAIVLPDQAAEVPSLGSHLQDIRKTGAQLLRSNKITNVWCFLRTFFSQCGNFKMVRTQFGGLALIPARTLHMHLFLGFTPSMASTQWGKTGHSLAFLWRQCRVQVLLVRVTWFSKTRLWPLLPHTGSLVFPHLSFLICKSWSFLVHIPLDCCPDETK